MKGVFSPIQRSDFKSRHRSDSTKSKFEGTQVSKVDRILLTQVNWKRSGRPPSRDIYLLLGHISKFLVRSSFSFRRLELGARCVRRV